MKTTTYVGKFAGLTPKHRYNVIPVNTGIQEASETMSKEYFVYILASQRNGTLYTGMTSDLPKRIWQHQTNQVDGFSKKYQVKQLVYYEKHNTAIEAITREKQIKKWNRAWKLKLIEQTNPHWQDLTPFIQA